MAEENNIDFAALTARVFSEENGKIFLGGEELRPDVRLMLRDQADASLRSDLFDIFQSTMYNEAARLALQSTSDRHTEFAKALHYWNTTMRKIYVALAKK